MALSPDVFTCLIRGLSCVGVPDDDGAAHEILLFVVAVFDDRLPCIPSVWAILISRSADHGFRSGLTRCRALPQLYSAVDAEPFHRPSPCSSSLATHDRASGHGSLTSLRKLAGFMPGGLQVVSGASDDLWRHLSALALPDSAAPLPPNPGSVMIKNMPSKATNPLLLLACRAAGTSHHHSTSIRRC